MRNTVLEENRRPQASFQLWLNFGSQYKIAGQGFWTCGKEAQPSIEGGRDSQIVKAFGCLRFLRRARWADAQRARGSCRVYITSADVSNSPVSFPLGWRFRLRRKLQNGCVLALA